MICGAPLEPAPQVFIDLFYGDAGHRQCSISTWHKDSRNRGIGQLASFPHQLTVGARPELTLHPEKRGRTPRRPGTGMEYFAQQLINGLTLGSIYGLIAIGYTMVYGIVGMINFAHGEVFMIGAFIALITILSLFAVGDHLGAAGAAYRGCWSRWR